MQRYKWYRELLKEKPFLQKLQTKMSLNNTSLRVREKKKRKIYYYKVMLFIVLSLFYFLWYWRQDLLSMHAMLLQAGTLSLPHMSASLIKTWPCALKLASPESKAFIAFLRIIMNCANQIRYKKDVYISLL